MKKQKNITMMLASASHLLMGANASDASAEVFGDESLKLESAVLFYSEPGRVTAIEPVVKVTKALDSFERISVKLVADTLTGASANGAVPTDSVQTFTKPSGKSGYETKPGDVPLDTSYRDQRVALSFNYDKPLSSTIKMALGASGSVESDYLSVSLNALFSKEINNKNTTVSGGISQAYDTIKPDEGIPATFKSMVEPGLKKPSTGDSESKSTTDLLLGMTQIIDKNSLILVNYSYSFSSGYHTEPYKLLSVVEDDTGRTQFITDDVPKLLYESRPDKRVKQSVYGQYKRYIDGDVLDFSYRYSSDDWGLKSDTLEMRYRYKIDGTSYIQPHIRYYQQSAVDFYKPYLLKSEVDAGNLPKQATADYRLAAMNTYTLGMEYGTKGWAVSLEYYLQSPDEPKNKIGILNNYELAPDVSAWMLRFNLDY